MMTFKVKNRATTNYMELNKFHYNCSLLMLNYFMMYSPMYVWYVSRIIHIEFDRPNFVCTPYGNISQPSSRMDGKSLAKQRLTTPLLLFIFFLFPHAPALCHKCFLDHPIFQIFFHLARSTVKSLLNYGAQLFPTSSFLRRRIVKFQPIL